MFSNSYIIWQLIVFYDILNSLFYAEDELNGNVIVSYSDILFESAVVKRLLESDADISIVVDIDWRAYYVNRKDHPLEAAENVIFNANNEVVKIGKVLTAKDDVFGEFIGMMKFSPRGADLFKRHFQRAKELFWNHPFQRAKTFQKAYITDMIQDMVDLGVPIHCVIIERGWKEIDTVEDYEKALKEFEEWTKPWVPSRTINPNKIQGKFQFELQTPMCGYHNGNFVNPSQPIRKSRAG